MEIAARQAQICRAALNVHLYTAIRRNHSIHTPFNFKRCTQGSALEDFFATCMPCWSMCQMIQEIEARENKKIKCCGSVGEGPKGPPIVSVKVSPEMLR